MVRAQIFTVAKIFDGEIKETDLRLEQEDLPPIQEGEYLVENLYLSVDPYMRAYAHTYTLGQVMIGIQVAKITQSRNPDFPAEKLIVGNLGWRTHTVIKPCNCYNIYLLPDLGNLPTSLALGALGATGISAYFGFLDVCKPIEGNTVVISGAAGAVGNHVGQIARLKKCKVIGLTGSEEKARWLYSLGFGVINYKTSGSLVDDLRRAAPRGIDCYFDNVGGEISTAVMSLMNPGGRVSVCGSVSSYNARGPVKATIIQPAIVQKQLTVQGFLRIQFKDRWMEAINQNLEWVRDGKVKYRETITDGFENAPKALIGLMKGQSVGKALVKVHDTVNFSDALQKFKKMNIQV